MIDLYTDVIDLSQENTLGELCLSQAVIYNLSTLTIEAIYFSEAIYFFTELLALANAYCENNLKKYCIQMIKQRIMISNAAFLYSIAFKYKEEVAKHSCYT